MPAKIGLAANYQGFCTKYPHFVVNLYLRQALFSDGHSDCNLTTKM